MLTEEQQQTLDRMVAMMTAQFEAANAKLARMKALEPQMHVESPKTQANRAAAMRDNGELPEGIMVMKEGRAIIMSRENAIVELKQGTATLN